MRRTRQSEFQLLLDAAQAAFGCDHINHQYRQCQGESRPNIRRIATHGEKITHSLTALRLRLHDFRHPSRVAFALQHLGLNALQQDGDEK